MHEQRLKQLRQKLKTLEEDDWRYQPVDKLIGLQWYLLLYIYKYNVITTICKTAPTPRETGILLVTEGYKKIVTWKLRMTVPST